MNLLELVVGAYGCKNYSICILILHCSHTIAGLIGGCYCRCAVIVHRIGIVTAVKQLQLLASNTARALVLVHLVPSNPSLSAAGGVFVPPIFDHHHPLVFVQ